MTAGQQESSLLAWSSPKNAANMQMSSAF